MGQQVDEREDRLTALQTEFVEQWIATRYNGTRAAKLAGYGGDDNVLAKQASRNLQKGKIQRAIAERLKGHGGTADEVISQLLEIARFSDPTLYMKSGGQLDYDSLKEQGRFVHTVAKTKDGWRVQCYSRLDAIKELARILKAGGVDAREGEWSGEVNLYFRGEAEQE